MRALSKESVSGLSGFPRETVVARDETSGRDIPTGSECGVAEIF